MKKELKLDYINNMTPSEALAISQDFVDYLRDLNGNVTIICTELDLEALQYLIDTYKH